MSMELKNINPHLLAANPWNSNKVNRTAFEKLKQSLTRLGTFKPIVVRELSHGTLQILGGYHRNEAAKELGLKEVPVLILKDIDDNKAKEISLIDNTRYGEDDQDLLQKILDDLDDLESFTETMPEIVVELPEEEDIIAELEKEEVTEKTSEETHKTLKFKFEIDKAEEIEALLVKIADANDYTYRDGYANLADSLYHVLVLEKK